MWAEVITRYFSSIFLLLLLSFVQIIVPLLNTIVCRGPTIKQDYTKITFSLIVSYNLLGVAFDIYRVS